MTLGEFFYFFILPLLLCLFILFCFHFLAKYQEARHLDDVTNATTLPRHWFWGHRKLFGYDSDFMRSIVNCAMSFPKCFNFWYLPNRSLVMFYHPETASSLLSSSEPKANLIYRYLRPWIGDGLLVSHGAKWKRNRRLLTPAFHFNLLKSYMTTFNSCSSVFIERLDEKLKEEKGKAIDIFQSCQLLTLDVILQCSMSSTTNCQVEIDNQIPYINAVFDAVDALTLRLRYPMYTWDFIFNNSKLGKRFNKAVLVLHRHTEELIKQRRAALEDEDEDIPDELNFDNMRLLQRKKWDFLDILLKTKDENGEGLSDAEIRDEVDTFLFEGHDTTASGLAWTIYNLAKHPEYQDKCREEILEIVGEERVIDWSAIKRMKYLSMCIKESMRLFPPVFFISRNLKHDMKIGERTFPEDTNIGTSIWALHRNPHVWKNPQLFDPERFTMENQAKRPTSAYIPFSAGPRNCIGQNFAMNELKSTTSKLLLNYRLYIDDDCPAAEPLPRVTLKSKNGIFIKMAPL